MLASTFSHTFQTLNLCFLPTLMSLPCLRPQSKSRNAKKSNIPINQTNSLSISRKNWGKQASNTLKKSGAKRTTDYFWKWENKILNGLKFTSKLQIPIHKFAKEGILDSNKMKKNGLPSCRRKLSMCAALKAWSGNRRWMYSTLNFRKQWTTAKRWLRKDT